MCRSKVCFIWEVVTRILLGWFSNRTATSVYDCARKSNNSLDHLAWPMAWPILGTGGRFQSLPRALPSPNDVPVLLLNQPIVYSGRQDLRFLAFVPFPARPNRKSRSSIFLPSETKRKRLLRTLPKIYVSHTWIGCIRKRSYTEFGMPMLQKETPGSVNVCWMESAPMAPFLSSENNLLFTREWTHFHICDCALGFSLVLKERCKTSQNWAIWK